MEIPMSVESLSLVLLLFGIALAFSDIHLSGWVLGWILLSGALLVQGFRSILNYSLEHGVLDATMVQAADEWMGLGFSLLIVASMYMMREVFAKHRLARERLGVISAAAQDAIVMIDDGGRIAFWNEAGRRIFGYSEREVQGRKLHELIVPQRRRRDFEKGFIDFRNTGHGLALGRTLELAGLRKDGTEIVTEVSLSAVSIDDVWHAICIFRDITGRKQAEQVLRLEHAVASRLAGAPDASDALLAVIRSVCEWGNWACGRYLRVDDATGTLRFGDYWTAPDAATQAFIEASRAFAYGPGVGIPGKVWQSGFALWIADVTKDARALTPLSTLESGLRCAFAFPVIAQGKTIGVLAFNSVEAREPDERLLAAAQVIGSQVGLLLLRQGRANA
jgi:two-component system cell cycle sensor histidine kinase/response regulator CckA